MRRHDTLSGVVGVVRRQTLADVIDKLKRRSADWWQDTVSSAVGVIRRDTGTFVRHWLQRSDASDGRLASACVIHPVWRQTLANISYEDARCCADRRQDAVTAVFSVVGSNTRANIIDGLERSGAGDGWSTDAVLQPVWT